MVFLSRRRWLAMWLAAVSAVLVSPTSFARGEKVHFSDFNDPDTVSPDWTLRTTSTTPRGSQKFLGPFANDTVSLSLKQLPKHQAVRITFDLLMIQDWGGLKPNPPDANSEAPPPSFWGLKIDGGASLVHAAFANGSSVQRMRRQTYPCLLPGERVVDRTGAATNNTLGFPAPNGDSVYKMSFTLPHSAENLQLDFYGDEVPEGFDLAWGLDNVSVETLTAEDLAKTDTAELRAAWDELGSADPEKGFQAAWKLIGQGDRAVEMASVLLAKTNKPDDASFGEHVKQLIADLDSDRFEVRQRAMRQLTQIAQRASPLLNRSLAKAGSAEARWRLREVLAGLDDIDPVSLDVETRRRLRLAKVLEIINSDAAQNLAIKLGL